MEGGAIEGGRSLVVYSSFSGIEFGVRKGAYRSFVLVVKFSGCLTRCEEDAKS